MSQGYGAARINISPVNRCPNAAYQMRWAPYAEPAFCGGRRRARDRISD